MLDSMGFPWDFWIVRVDFDFVSESDWRLGNGSRGFLGGFRIADPLAVDRYSKQYMKLRPGNDALRL
jgi:hypothetical protein